MTETIDLAALPWSAPKRVQTRLGERLLRTTSLPEGWWDLWRSSKEQLKAAGYSCSKDEVTGTWSVCHWQAPSAEEVAAKAEAVEQSMAASSDFHPPAPAGCVYLPYQRAGIRYALTRQATLFGDEMGLGKTIQAIGVMNVTLEDRTQDADRMLVICPASLRLNWQRELQKWLVKPLRTVVIGIDDWPVSTKDTVVIINYDVLHKYHDQLRHTLWDVLVIDEAHYCKNPKARRTAEIVGRRAWRDQTEVEPIPARRRLMLTGTPIVNRPRELWPLVHYLDPVTWDRAGAYMRRYCGGTMGTWGYEATGASNLEELHRRLRESVMVRRLKMDVLTELPPKVRQILVLNANGASNLVKREREIYDRYQQQLAVAQYELETAETEEQYRAAASRLTKTRGILFEEISAVRHEVGLAKVTHVIEHLENGDAGKVVVFAHHKDVLRLIREGIDPTLEHSVELTGDTHLVQRQAAVDKFQQDDDVRWFFGTIGAAGVGITLTAASHVVFAELDWVPGNVSQAEDRLHRIGQRESVLVQHLVFDQSLDARMVEVIVEKQRIIELALDRGDTTQKVVEQSEQTVFEIEPERAQPNVPFITPEQKAAIHTGLRILAGLDPDYAGTVNGVGFNKYDGWVGHSLAESPSLSQKQAAYARKIVRKYHRQLGNQLLVEMGLEPVEKKP